MSVKLDRTNRQLPRPSAAAGLVWAGVLPLLAGACVITTACGTARGDIFFDPTVTTTGRQAIVISGQLWGPNGNRRPGESVEVEISSPGQGTVTQTLVVGMDNHVTFQIPDGYDSSKTSFVFNHQTQRSRLSRSWWYGWQVTDPIVANGTDVWALAASSERTLSLEEYDPDADQLIVTNFNVNAAFMNVTYGSGLGNIFDVTLTQGVIELSTGYRIDINPGQVGTIDLNTNTFAFELNGQLSSASTSIAWSMAYSGEVVPNSAEGDCPSKLVGSGQGFNVHGGVPDPATLGLLAIGALGTARRRRA